MLYTVLLAAAAAGVPSTAQTPVPSPMLGTNFGEELERTIRAIDPELKKRGISARGVAIIENALRSEQIDVANALAHANDVRIRSLLAAVEAKPFNPRQFEEALRDYQLLASAPLKIATQHELSMYRELPEEDKFIVALLMTGTGGSILLLPAHLLNNRDAHAK